MNFPRKPSIEEIGLKKYLDDTATDHSNSGYDDFVKMLDAEASKPTIARAFNVRDKKTIYKWIKIYEKEQRHANKT